MFRRLLTIMVAVQIFVFGSLQVMAQEGINPPITQSQQSTTELIQEDSESTQYTNATVNQNQTTKTDDHDSVKQGQVVDGVISQEQIPNTDDQIKQTQTSNVTAVQGQLISNSDSLEAGQDQKASMNSSQSQQVSTSDNSKNQDQQTSVATDQEQVLSIDGNTSLAGQVQYTNIETNQQSEMNKDDNGDDLGQKTKVEAKQETALITSGTGNINQTQSAEASGEINSNGDEPVFSLKVLVKNGLEIIKRGADTFIKVIQRIDINEDTIEIVENEFILENSLTGQIQEYTNIYDWGTLYIFNKAIASIMNDGIEAFMESVISFDFVLGKPKNEGNNNEEEDNGNDNEDNNGNSNEEDNANNNEENNVNYIENKESPILWELDSDNDGISDFLEIVKFKTDPFNPDTDGDGLTDLYEVAYHDANKKQNFQVIHLTKQERFNYLLQMDYSPKDLNPLMKDTNRNGINDGEEDFDQDGIFNVSDLNPYDGLSNYLSD